MSTRPRHRLSVILGLAAAALLVLTGVLFVGIQPAMAGGGGIIDPNNPCAFNGFFGTFSDTGTNLKAFWSSHGQTFTGVGSSIITPFTPTPVVGTHHIYSELVVTGFVGDDIYVYNVYHIVTGCPRPGSDAAI